MEDLERQQHQADRDQMPKPAGAESPNPSATAKLLANLSISSSTSTIEPEPPQQLPETEPESPNTVLRRTLNIGGMGGKKTTTGGSGGGQREVKEEGDAIVLGEGARVRPPLAQRQYSVPGTASGIALGPLGSGTGSIEQKAATASVMPHNVQKVTSKKPISPFNKPIAAGGDDGLVKQQVQPQDISGLIKQQQPPPLQHSQSLINPQWEEGRNKQQPVLLAPDDLIASALSKQQQQQQQPPPNLVSKSLCNTCTNFYP